MHTCECPAMMRGNCNFDGLSGGNVLDRAIVLRDKMFCGAGEEDWILMQRAPSRLPGNREVYLFFKKNNSRIYITIFIFFEYHKKQTRVKMYPGTVV